MRLSKIIALAALLGPISNLAMAACGAYTLGPSFTVSHTGGKVGAANVSNYPLLIAGTYPALAGTGSGGNATSLSGYDIRPFSDNACSVALNYQLVPGSYGTSTGAIEMFVQVPTLYGSGAAQDTVVYLGVGNSGITTDGSSTSTWDSNFYGVYHLQENAGNTTVADSSTKGHTAVATNNTSTYSVAGPFSGGGIGKAFNFGSSGGVTFPSTADFNPTGAFTVEFWMNENAQSGFTNFATFGNYGANGFYLQVSNTVTLLNYNGYNNGAGNFSGNSGNAWATGAWHYEVFTFLGTSSSTGAQWYRDGATDGSAHTSNVLYWPSVIQGYLNSNVRMAEFRFSNGVQRSASYITANYNNMNSPSTFYTIAGLPVTLITTSPLTAAYRGVAYTNTLTAAGGTAPYTWAVTAGSLPTGLSLNASTGVISGTPTVISNPSFTIQVTDSLSAMASGPYTLNVNGSSCTLTMGANTNLSATGTSWTGSGTCPTGTYIPAAGDAAIIAATAYTLAIDQNWTVNNFTSSSNMEVKNGVTFDYQGNSYMNAGTLTVDAGGTLTPDNSLSGPGTYITLSTSGTGATANGYFAFNGTQGNHATITGIANSNGDQPAWSQGASADFGALTATFTDFSNLGNTTIPMWYWTQNYGGGGGGLTIKNSTFTHVGVFESNNVASSNTVDIENNYWTQTLGESNLYLPLQQAGTFKFYNNAFDAQINCYSGACNEYVLGGDFRYNVWGAFGGFAQSGSIGYTFIGNVNGANAANSPPSGPGPAPNTFYGNELLSWGLPTNNTHTITDNASVNSMTFANSIIEDIHTVSSTCTCGLVFEANPNSGQTYSVEGFIATMTPEGNRGSGPYIVDIANGAGGVTQTNSIALTHSTAPYGTYTFTGASQQIMLQLAHGDAGDSNETAVEVIQNNLSAAVGTDTVAGLVGGGGGNQLNFILYSGANHNDTYNLGTPTGTSCGGSGCGQTIRGYYFNTNGGNPGPNDISVNPNWVDPYRNIYFWDRDYPGSPNYGTTYAAYNSATAYTFGQIVTYNNASYWQNYHDPYVNIRCINPSGCPASTAASVWVTGTTYGQYWEPNALYEARHMLNTNAANNITTPIIDNSLSLCEQTTPCTFAQLHTCTQATPCTVAEGMIAWERQAFNVQNRSVCGAASDGSDIGAVPCRPVYEGVVAAGSGQ